MSIKEEFIEIFTNNITRQGADALLEYLEQKSDFFTAPASARYHCAYEGGLCEHSVNVYHCLLEYLSRERVQELYGLEYSPETIAIVALLHDLCKVGCYKAGTRNVKDDNGKWQAVPSYTFEEAMAIRWHMGFSGTEDARTVGNAFQKFPLAFALSTADMEASYFLETDG